MGFYAQVIVPLLCDFGLDRPFVARYRRELLANASGSILEIGFGTGLNLPHYHPHVRKLTTVDPPQCRQYWEAGFTGFRVIIYPSGVLRLGHYTPVLGLYHTGPYTPA